MSGPLKQDSQSTKILDRQGEAVIKAPAPALTPEQKIAALRKLTKKQKRNLIPPEGIQFNLDIFVFEVFYTDVENLRFQAKLVDVIEEEQAPLIVGASMKDIAKVGISKK